MTGRPQPRPSVADVYWVDKTFPLEAIRPGGALWLVMLVALALI
ncbi:MAG TPA: hypothetical protein VJ994_10415 [Paracoccaceae bacterium]|nr:hypothetical protein [Paracoccaceae bacterium]